MRYLIKAVLLEDLDQLFELSSHLNSVNLPADREAIRSIIEHSTDSFSGAIKDPTRRCYVFALHDRDTDKVVATSMIFGQLGRRDAPYIYYRVRKEERYSKTLDRHFVHDVLQIGYSYDGPTELGGLVTHPDCRRSDAKLGLMISYVRFLFIAMHRDLFQDEILAELLPPLQPDGTSLLWQALGHHFTGMTYREADVLSRRNKEFIRGLFPDGDIYASLLPADAQSVIGKVGKNTRGVEKMLRRIGFRYANRIDPFDGGPHFIAKTGEISLIGAASPAKSALGPPQGAQRFLLASMSDKAPWFQCVAAFGDISPDGAIIISREVFDALDRNPGENLWYLPI
jgi:arginine N-succinyltransferase